jgi:hypothetical protein
MCVCNCLARDRWQRTGWRLQYLTVEELRIVPSSAIRLFGCLNNRVIDFP